MTVEDTPHDQARYLFHDRDAKFSEDFNDVFLSVGIEPLKFPPRSPNLNDFAGRWVRAVKDECLDQLILFSERSLHHDLKEYPSRFLHEPNHLGLKNVIPFPYQSTGRREGTVHKSEHLGGLLNLYQRAA